MPDLSIGAIGAGLVGALAALLGLVISKESKTSEFRQQWIDSVRKEIGDFLSAYNSIADLTHRDFETKNDRLSELRESYRELNRALFMISLRLNSDEKSSRALIGEANALVNLLRSPGPIQPAAIRPIETAFQLAAKQLLKKEWKRVKRGEPFFLITRWATAIAAVVFFAWLAITGWRALPGPSDENAQPVPRVENVAPKPTPSNESKEERPKARGLALTTGGALTQPPSPAKGARIRGGLPLPDR